jgi:hypothetical protein
MKKIQVLTAAALCLSLNSIETAFAAMVVDHSLEYMFEIRGGGNEPIVVSFDNQLGRDAIVITAYYSSHFLLDSVETQAEFDKAAKEIEKLKVLTPQSYEHAWIAYLANIFRDKKPTKTPVNAGKTEEVAKIILPTTGATMTIYTNDLTVRAQCGTQKILNNWSVKCWRDDTPLTQFKTMVEQGHFD